MRSGRAAGQPAARAVASPARRRRVCWRAPPTTCNASISALPPSSLLLVRVDLRERSEIRTPQPPCCAALLGEIQQIPGVRAASFSQLGVFSGGESRSTTIEVEGYVPTDGQDLESDLGRGRARLLLDAGRADPARDATSSRAIAASAAGLRHQRGLRQTVLRSPESHRHAGHGDRRRRAHGRRIRWSASPGTRAPIGLRDDVEPRYFVRPRSAADLGRTARHS